MVRALDTKHNILVILKIGGMDEIIRERDVYIQLEGIPGIPALYGSCVTSPTGSYLSVQPFATDLFNYVADNGVMCPTTSVRGCGNDSEFERLVVYLRSVDPPCSAAYSTFLRTN